MSMRARRSPSLLGAAVLATAAAIGAAPAQAAPAAPAYVALGDSYSSLPADATVGASQQERSCGRSTHNYPKLVAATLGFAPNALRDNTCGGAKTDDAFTRQRAGSPKTGYYTAAPQLTGIGAETTLVTISLGGNDGDLFANILDACAAPSTSKTVRCTADQRTRPAGLSDGAVAALLARITTANERIVLAVRERAPRARILVVGYPSVLDGDRSCAAIRYFRTASIPWMRSILTERLNRAVRQAATSARAEYVDMEPASKGHELCSARPWINGVDDDPRAAQMHPFPEEGRAVAAAITVALRASGPRL